MADYAEDAAALLDAHGWADCHVMGSSFGGMVAQEFAIRFPERVDRLVLSCSSSGGPGGSSYPIHEFLDLTAEQAAKRAMEVQDTRRDAEWQVAHGDEVRVAVERREAQVARRASDPVLEMGFRRQLAARWAHDTYDRLPSLTMPVLIIGGTSDGQAPPANQEVLHRRIPHSRLEFFEGGHGAFEQQDPRAMPTVIEFLMSSD